MNWNVFLIGIMLSLFLYVGGYRMYGIIAFFAFFLIAIFSNPAAGKTHAKSGMLEPIIVESKALTWGSGTKQMPKEMYRFEESKEYPKSEPRIWGKPLGKGIGSWMAKSIGGLFKEDD